MSISTCFVLILGRVGNSPYTLASPLHLRTKGNSFERLSSSRTMWGRRWQAEHSKEKGCQCEARPDQYLLTCLFKAANSSPTLMRNLTNSENFRRLSLLPGLI